MGDHLWINAIVIMAGTAGIACLMALFAPAIRAAVISLFAIFYQPISIIYQTCRAWLQSFVAWLRGQLKDESARPGEGPAYYIIGAVLYTALTVIFVFCDFGMVMLTAEAMGMDKGTYRLPVDTATLTALTLVTSALFWGAIILDLLGVTHLGPWRKSCSVGTRRCLMGLAVFCVLLAVGLLMGMAYWRGDVLSQLFASEAQAAVGEHGLIVPDTSSGLSGVTGSALTKPNDGKAMEPGIEIGGNTIDVTAEQGEDATVGVSDLSRKILLGTLMGIAALSTFSAVFSAWGLAALLKFLMLLALSVIMFHVLGLGAFCCWLITVLLNGIAAFVQAIIDIFVQIGNRILGLFGYRAAPERAAQPAGNYSEQAPPTPEPRPQPADSSDAGFNPFGRR